jgi:glucose/arabinose dehydrogenase
MGCCCQHSYWHCACYDSAEGRVVAFNRNGGFLGTLISGLTVNRVHHVAVDAAGNIYVPEWSTPGKLQKCDSSVRLIGVYGGRLDQPWAVAVGPDGAVYVTEDSKGAHKITCM